MNANAFRSVVLIDDNPDDLFLNRLVVQHSRYPLAVLEFNSSIAALKFLSEEKTAEKRILLLDINMPYLDGFGFLERGQGIGSARLEDNAIIMLTTSLHSEDKARAEANPLVYRYMRKPLTIDSFNELVESLLS